MNALDQMRERGDGPTNSAPKSAIVAGNSTAAIGARLKQDAVQTNKMVDTYLEQRAEFIEKKLGVGILTEEAADFDFSDLFPA